MSTKDHQDWLSKQNQTFDNNEISEPNQYNNINLNHQNYKDENGWKTLNSDNSNGRKDYDFVNSNKSSLLKFEKDVKNSCKSGGDISKHLETLNLYDSEDDKKRWKQAWNLSDTKKNNNNSTLSLHIAAYENSNAASAASEIKCDIDQINKQSKKGSKTWKNIKDALADSNSVIQNSFEFPRQNNNEQPLDPEIMQFKASQKLCNFKDRRSNARKQKCARVADVAEDLSILYEQNQITKAEFFDRLNAKNEELGYKEKMVHKSWLQFVSNVEKRFQQNNNAFVSELDERIAKIHRKFVPNFCLSESLDSQQDSQDTSSSDSHDASSTASNSNHDEQALQKNFEFRNSDESDDDDDATESNVTAAGDEEERQVVEESQKSRRPYGLLKLGGVWEKKDEPKRIARNFAAEERKNHSPIISSSRKRRFESDSSKTSVAATSKRTSNDENQRVAKLRRLQQTAASEEISSQNNSAQDGTRQSRRSDISDSIAEALAQPVSHQNQLNWLRRQTANNLVPVDEQLSTPTRLQPSRKAKSKHCEVLAAEPLPQQQSSPSIPLIQQKLKPGSIRNPQISIPLLDSLSLMQDEQDAAAGNTAQKVQESSEADSPQDEQSIVESQSEHHLQKTAETANEKIPAAVINPSQLQTNAVNSTEMRQQQSNPANLNATGLQNPGGIIPLQAHTSANDSQPPLPQLQQFVTANVNPGVFNQRPFQQRQQNSPQNINNNSIQDLLAQQAANSARFQQSIQQRLHQLNEPQQLLPTLPNQQPSYFTFLQNLNKNQKDIFDFQSARNLELLRTTIAAANQAMGVNKKNNNGN